MVGVKGTNAHWKNSGRAKMADWKISGEYMESCNCDYLCPCIYTNSLGETTNDNCTALLVFRVDDGNYEGVNLDGLSFAMVIKSGKVMSEGNWAYGVIVDEAGDEAQRAALSAIASGEAGGAPSMIRDNLVDDFRGVEVKAIDFVMDGLKRSVSIPGALDFRIEGVASALDNGEPLYADNTPHPANSRLALARTQESHVHCLGINLDMSGKGNNGHYAPFTWAA
jgi:hypothetical protein